ncbi:hypothetical protein Q7P37_007846 [Cladosporium fusiforme]
MPARSTGCFQCRKRKIRCDEGRPGCERCAKHGVPCPGYRGERGGLEFEDQTRLTAQKAMESYGGRTALVSRKSSNTGSLRLTPEVVNLDAKRSAFQQWSVVSPLQTLNSPAANKVQLYDAWLNIYTPETTGMQGLHFDYLRESVGLAEGEPALRDGLNTLALVQVGHAHNDERLLAASVPSYGRALASLAYAVSKATSVRDNTVLAAASLLVVCEFYDQIKTQGMGWFGHVEGVQQLLLARGPESLDTNLSLMLFCNARHASFAKAVLLRKATPYDTPAWRAAALRAPLHDGSVKLFDMEIRVPRLLQRADDLDLKAASAVKDIEALIKDCEELEVEFKSWLCGMHDSLGTHGIDAYKVVSIEQFETFASLITDRTLPTCYRFTNFLSGYLHSQYWICMHYLRSTIKDLRELRQSFDPYWKPDLSQAVTDEELNGYAFDLCRCIPHFVEPSSGTQGHIGIFLPLAVILMHFKSRQNWKWCMWALHVKEHVFTMGLRQPHVEENSLPFGIVRTRSGMTPFPNSDPNWGIPPSPESREIVDLSPSPEIDGTAFAMDEFANVDLGVDWDDFLPAPTADEQGTAEKSSDSGVLEMNSTCVGFDTSVGLVDFQ